MDNYFFKNNKYDFYIINLTNYNTFMIFSVKTQSSTQQIKIPKKSYNRLDFSNLVWNCHGSYFFFNKIVLLRNQFIISVDKKLVNYILCLLLINIINTSNLFIGYNLNTFIHQYDFALILTL